MSDIKANAVVCEMCMGKLILRNENSFECESCGANYLKEWIKAKVQEITGKVRIEGPVQVDGLQSIDSLTKNIDTFIKLGKFNDAFRLSQRIQAEYPDDYRGWWGAVRSHSHELTLLTLDNEDYACIISDGKSAIKVANSAALVGLQGELSAYVSKVYLAMSEKHKNELQKQKEASEKELVKKRALQVEKERIKSSAERVYEQAKASRSQAEEDFANHVKVNKAITALLYVVACGWSLFILISLLPIDFWGVLGYMMIGLALPIGVVYLLTKFMTTIWWDSKSNIEGLRGAEVKTRSAFYEKKAHYETACANVESMENILRERELTLSELSKDQTMEFKEAYISGKVQFITDEEGECNE